MTRKLLALVAAVLTLAVSAPAAASALPATGDHGPAVTVTVNDTACGDWTFDLVPNRPWPIHVKYQLGDGEWQHVVVDADAGYVTVDVPGPAATEVTYKVKGRGGYGDPQTFTGGHPCPPVTATPTTDTPTTETPTSAPPTSGPEGLRPVASQPDCGDLADAGVELPLTSDDADWAEVLDGDGDGVACEGYSNGTTSTTATPASSGALPRTGSTVGPMVAAGLGLLVVGGALVLGRRHLAARG